MRFITILTRISGIMLIAPFFSSAAFPIPVRAAFCLVTAFVISSSMSPGAAPVEPILETVVVIMAGELLFGLLLGFVALCVFSGLQFAGQMISFQMGFSLVTQMDPQSGMQSTILEYFYKYIGLLIFLSINGHHWFFLAISESFAMVPVGGVAITEMLAGHLIRLSAEILVIGLKIAGPVIAVIITSDVLVGLIGRTAPQINILIVGMPLKILIGFGCMSSFFYFLPRYLEGLFAGLFRTFFALMRAMG
ncbi:MAG TPA: flagellar biosynthetic protein FliR [Acidobacteriota bacterium]|nr:flagellar biosynthetic protein FliR [Acidobacteriota bacterium]